MATATMVSMIANIVSIIFFTHFVVVDANNYSLVVAQVPSLHLTPSSLVEKSTGFKAGTKVRCERVHINGLPRLKNLGKFGHSVTVNVSYALSSSRPPNVQICFHRNASLGVGMCPQGQWGKLSKDSWARTMSPFDHKLLDICISGSSFETLKVFIDEEFSYSRIISLVFGSVLMTTAWALSKSLVFYYSSAMAVGVLLVILMVLFQGMKLLPTGRKNSLAVFLYASLLGFGALLFRDVPRLLHSLCVEIGIGEEYNPLIIFLVLFLVLAGAWLGFWAVRKLILTEDGSIDEGISNFVGWALWVIGASMVLQSSVDPLLSAANLICGILLSVVLRNINLNIFLLNLYEFALELPGVLISFRYLFKKGKSKYRRSRNPDAVATGESYSPVTKKSLSDSDPFYSTFHSTPERRKFSKEEWEKLTRETTKRSLEELVSSPDFSRWAVAHADRITLTPTNAAKQPRRWIPWF